MQYLTRQVILLFLATALVSLLAACTRPDPLPAVALLLTPTQLAVKPTPTLAPRPSATTVSPGTAVVPTPTSSATPPPQPSATPLSLRPGLEPCGLQWPPVPESALPATDITARAVVLPEAIPEDVRPALEYLLARPGDVGLAAYRLDAPETGAFLNPDLPLPIASVAKIITLITYAEGVAAGELDPEELVPLPALNAFYLPRTDLSAHQQALNALAADDKLFGDTPYVRLDDIAMMMIRYSSNAAADYLHFRLGQARLEEQMSNLGLVTHTAPCPFLGQFLLMGNHQRAESNRSAITALAAEPGRYGVAVVALADLYRRDAVFREAEIAARNQGQRPSLGDQRLFTATLNTRASAAQYAALMGRLAQNDLADPESAFLVRRHLEWPMHFENNQELFYNLGFKGGALPGVLTVAYYAYTKDEVAPFVVALFFNQLPDSTYRQWQRTQSHDALARWLLADSSAIGQLRQWLAAP